MKKNSFTIIEFLIILGILGMTAVLSVGAFSFLVKKTDLDTSRNNIISTLNLARNKTLSSEQNSRYGVFFDSASTPDRYIFFKGPSYALRDISSDRIYNLPSSVEIASISLNNSSGEVVFNRPDGSTSNYGFLTLHSIATTESRVIYVYFGGETSTASESTPPEFLTDSRHVHFDLGWSISGATTLRFNFINAGQIKDVDMAQFFSGSKFSWDGQFLINAHTQQFKVHTHALDPNTILCIHRDRNKDKNNEEVYVYIVQDGIQKEIAHYDDDLLATVYKGAYVWNEMEKK